MFLRSYVIANGCSLFSTRIYFSQENGHSRIHVANEAPICCLYLQDLFQNQQWRILKCHKLWLITPSYKINFKLQMFVSIFVSNNFQLRMNFNLVQTHFNIGRTKDLSRVMSALKTPLRAQIWLWTYWTLIHTLWVTTGFLTGCSYFVSRDHKSHNPDHSDDPSFSVMTFRSWSDRNSK